MKRIVIIGASGHGKVIADIAKKNGYTDIGFLDDNTQLTSCGDYPVLGHCDQFRDFQCDFFVAIGNTAVRRRFCEELISAKKNLPVLIHPSAVIAEDVVIGGGTVVMAGAVINPASVIGRGCIINTCSSVDHDNLVDDFSHIAVGAHLSGTVHIGAETWVGAGAIIRNNLEIASGCVIGAGAVVVCDLVEKGTYIGVPARKM